METKAPNFTPKKTGKFALFVAGIFVIIVCIGIFVYSYGLEKYAEFRVCGELKGRAAWLESRQEDWAALNHYREANAKLPPPSENEKRVVFIGDSITDWWDDPGKGGFFHGKPYINRGIGAQTTPQMLIRFRPDVIALNPKAVVILAGVNDIGELTGPTTLEAIQDNLASMSELARVKNIKVILASVLPVSEERDGNLSKFNQKIKALNKWIKEYADKNSFTYLDYYSAVADERGFLKNQLSDDGLHPNAQGYAVMTPLAERAISSALEMKTE